MIEYSKFYEENVQLQSDNFPQIDEVIRYETELKEYKNLIQQLGYAHFDD